MIVAPTIETVWNRDRQTLRVTATFADGAEPQKNHVAWSSNRHQPYTLEFEYDSWQSLELNRVSSGTFSGEIELSDNSKSVEIVTTHTHTVDHLPLSISSPLIKFDR